MNIVSCAMFSAFVLSMKERPSVEKLTEYYAKAMMTGPMRWFCRMMGKKKFSEQDVQGMKVTAALKAADRNPYSWNMEFLPYADGSSYEARFTRCGICTLMKSWACMILSPPCAAWTTLWPKRAGLVISSANTRWLPADLTAIAEIRKNRNDALTSTLKHAIIYLLD